MPNWKEIDLALKTMLRLKTDPIAFKRFEDAGDLARVEGVVTVGSFFHLLPGPVHGPRQSADRGLDPGRPAQ